MAKRRKTKKSLKHFKRKITRFFLVVGIVTVVSGVGYGLWAMRNISRPLSVNASTDSITVENSSDQQTTYFNLELNSKNLVKKASITLVDTEENVIRELALPQETLLHLPYGMEEFKLQGLYKIAELENSDKLFSVINQTLIDYFGVATRNVYITSLDDNLKSFYDNLTNPFVMFNLTFNEDWTNKHIISPDSRWNLINLAQKINNIPIQNRVSLNILENEIGYKETSIDQSIIIKTDFNKLDSYIKRIFQNSEILSEKANISIANGTEITGLGSKVSRLITNMGGVIVNVGNTETIQEKTVIQINNKKWITSSTLEKITKTIPDSEISSELNTDNRTDILIILGKNYAKIVTGKENM
jgi:hypothetical protein